MSSSPHDLERSLLQKAIRKGNAELTEKVIKYLTNVGDSSWLKNRFSIIKYEECWTFTGESYIDLARSVKNKNAAGLGSLAVKNSQSDDIVIRTVARGIEEPEKFWEWVRSLNTNQLIIETAFRASKRSNFPEDKAMMFAAAYLAVNFQVPETRMIEPNNDPNFPYWIAIDKHTDRGKEIYIEACKEIELDAFIGMQLGFYFEGSLVNQLQESPYWEQLKLWHLKQLGYSYEQAEEIWETLRPRIINKSRSTVERLIERIEANQTLDQDQLSLFC